MTGGTFHRVSHGKAPQHADKQRDVSDDRACSASPARSPRLITQLLLNLKCKEEEGGGREGGREGVDEGSLILLSVFFFSPLPFYLSVVEHVTLWEPSLRQLMQTRLIS